MLESPLNVLNPFLSIRIQNIKLEKYLDPFLVSIRSDP
jgi:hypothetical protein